MTCPEHICVYQMVLIPSVKGPTMSKCGLNSCLVSENMSPAVQTCKKLNILMDFSPPAFPPRHLVKLDKFEPARAFGVAKAPRILGLTGT
jgi:hypothetical protein